MSAFGTITDITQEGRQYRFVSTRRSEKFSGAGRRLGADICRHQTQRLRLAAHPTRAAENPRSSFRKFCWVGSAVGPLKISLFASLSKSSARC
jgi:hypothetical protein